MSVPVESHHPNNAMVIARCSACLMLGLLLMIRAPEGAQAQVAPQPAADPSEELPDAPFSPRGAFFRSLLIPGWGQASVGSPGRGAVYFSMAAGSYAMTYVARQQLLDARDQQNSLRDAGLLGADENTEFVIARERHFEDWAALSIFLMFISGADAYVSAYLADFDERVGVVPRPGGALEIQTRFPLGTN